jgi:imidazole glycerol-phosphate synthase subunit HisH
VSTAIIKYNAGNTASVRNALKRLGVEAEITDDPERLSGAERVIFPGVGEASSAMSYLNQRGLAEAIRTLKQPVLGICLGMHLLCESSEENHTEGTGVLSSRVRRFPKAGMKVPHIGWNSISDLRGPLFKNVAENSYVYFVHGYYVEENDWQSAACDYALRFCAAFEYENFYAVQFHPERSGAVGEQILENFIKL